MKMRFLKAWRDLAMSPGRTVVAVFALVLGIGGLGAILVSYSILNPDLNANFQNTVPPHLVLKSAEFDKLNLENFKKLPEVEAAEFRDFTLHRIEVKPNEWIPLWLFGVEDFNKPGLARIFHEKGKKIPQNGSLLIERDGLKVSDIEIGKSVNIRIGSKITKVPVSGICFDPAMMPATQDAFIFAYTDKKTFQSLTGMPVNERLLIRLRNAHSADDVKKISEKLITILKNSDIKNIAVQIPKFNEHPHQWQLNTLLALIGSIGFLSFFMGAVLVSQLMRNVLAGQVRQIGIMKAIGASRFQIFQIYLMLLLIIGILSGAIAIPIAIASGSAFAKFVAGILNFNILTTSVPYYVMVYLTIVSLFLPVLLSLSVLLKGTGISVKEALNDFGINAKANTLQLNILKKWAVPGTLILAIRNSFRNSRRLTVTMLAMALGVALFSTGFNVRQSLWELLSGVKDEMRYDVQVVLNKQVSPEHATALFSKILNVKGTEYWKGGRGEIQSKLLSTDKGAGIIALPPDTKYLKLKLTDGRWLLPDSRPEIVMNQQAWALYNKPQLNKDVAIVIGTKSVNVKVVGMVMEFDKAKIYIPEKIYKHEFNSENLINTIVFAAEDNEYEKVLTLKRQIEKAIVNSDLDVVYVMSQSERVKIIFDHLNIILSVILILSFMVLLVSAIGMASATGINIGERTREIGIMRAIGATPLVIYKIFLTEGMIISLFSIVIGLLISFPLGKVAATFFGNLILGADTRLEFAFSTTGFFITLVVTIVFGWFASKIPARNAIKIPTRVALGYE